MATSSIDRAISAAVVRSGVSRAVIASALRLQRSALDWRINGRTRWTLAETVALAEVLGTSVSDLLQPVAADRGAA